jgi:ATP-dependent protease ClpP protease subunit
MYDASAMSVMKDIDAAKGSDLKLRINTDGGDVMGSYGAVAKYKEFEGKKSVVVDGKANSMGLFFLAYANDEVEALDVSSFVLHRAAYPKWFEKSESMTADMWSYLNGINANLRTALEAKIDVTKFEKIKGVTLDEVFSNDTRIDVVLNAKEAKQIGLIDKIVQITPEKKSEIEAMSMKIAASTMGLTIEQPKPIEAINTEIKSEQKNKMNIEKLKSEHPDVYASVIALGVEQEKDRVSAWLVFADVDADGVKAGIESGKQMGAKETAEFGRKALAKVEVAKIEANAQGDVTTTKVGEKVEAELTEVQKLEASMKDELAESVKRLNSLN